MANSMQKAREILEGARGTPLPLAERENKTIQLAACMLEEANRTQTWRERRQQAQLARMMHDPIGKAFTTSMTDQCFRSHRPFRIASQLVYLITRLGVPGYLSPDKRWALHAFRYLGKPLAHLLVPMAVWMLRRETANVILPGESEALHKHIALRRRQGVRLNLNHLGEAILGEEEAERRLQVYLNDLALGDIEYVSIKISTIYSQIHLLAWNETRLKVTERLRELYRAAMRHHYHHPDGRVTPKFVNLDMEEYRDLLLTKEIFMDVLNESEFHNFSAGIVLQAYIPDSFEVQKELTAWAQQRIGNGGAPIKIRLVKGANLAMEQFEASVHEWPQAPFPKKSEVDANFKRMVTYGCRKEHTRAVQLGIGSHNLFDIAYAMLLRSEEGVEEEVCFEMLEGMADHIRRVVHELSGSMLLYCPVARKEDFQSAIAYLIRRLDENTGPQNFLRHTFGLRPHTPEWEEQVQLFQKACAQMEKVSASPRRTQNRLLPPAPPSVETPFDNEPNTDFSRSASREWVAGHIENWKRVQLPSIPCVIGGREIHQHEPEGLGWDPAYPDKPFYRYSLATEEQVGEAVRTAKEQEVFWGAISPQKRNEILARAAQKVREKRGDLIGAMMRDGGKTPSESDPEVSEAIDFAEYYRHSLREHMESSDVRFRPRGTILVTPPWNFPCAIPFGGMVAALAAGNCVLFKPAPETVLIGWMMVNVLWDAGVPKEVLQFINCVDDPVGSRLISDPRLNGVILTGATATARLFLRLNPQLHLWAETGGKNAMIITAMADRDLAIKDLVQSAFGHSGQKCSAASLAILEAEVYDDPNFRQQLRDAVQSLHVGPAWDPRSKIVPLIRLPEGPLLRGLTKLDPGEEWLVPPSCDPQNPHLWSPGVRWGVKENSFIHETELFGPVLGVMRATNLQHALHLANATQYGLTSGLQSLDEREQRIWLHNIEAGNLYINRSVTGAIVRRQPFGGTKASSVGHGAKAGGPNYITQFFQKEQIDMPREKSPVPESVNNLTIFLNKLHLSAEMLGLWYASVASYAYWGPRLKERSDPTSLVGQDNFFYCVPRRRIALRIQEQDKILDLLRIIAAAISVGASLEISWNAETSPIPIDREKWHKLIPECRFTKENNERFLKRVKAGAFDRVRLASPPAELLLHAANQEGVHICSDPVLANGRYELLHYLREVAVSCDYHRYGNLALREEEVRRPIL